MPVIFAMHNDRFNSVIRYVKRVSIDKVEALQIEIRLAMERLEMEANPTKAFKGIPDGSNHVSPIDIILWARKIEQKHRPAVRQLIVIDATISNRIDL